ncbi:hypothetical protein ABIF94_001173 [Bradyrhizobium ottawaense]
MLREEAARRKPLCLFFLKTASDQSLADNVCRGAVPCTGMTHSGHASRRAGVFHGAGKLSSRELRMTLLCSNQIYFGAGSPPAASIRSEILVRHSVAGTAGGQGEPRIPAPSAVVAHLLGIVGDLLAPVATRRAIASFRPLLCCSPGKLRFPVLLKSGATAGRVRAHSRLRCPVHTPLQVSRCAVLTQSRNSGNNLQLSEKLFRRSEIAISRIQATPSNGAKRRTITRPRHFKLTPLG